MKRKHLDEINEYKKTDEYLYKFKILPLITTLNNWSYNNSVGPIYGQLTWSKEDKCLVAKLFDHREKRFIISFIPPLYILNGFGFTRLSQKCMEIDPEYTIEILQRQ